MPHLLPHSATTIFHRGEVIDIHLAGAFEIRVVREMAARAVIAIRHRDHGRPLELVATDDGHDRWTIESPVHPCWASTRICTVIGYHRLKAAAALVWLQQRDHAAPPRWVVWAERTVGWPANTREPNQPYQHPGPVQRREVLAVEDDRTAADQVAAMVNDGYQWPEWSHAVVLPI